MLSVFDFSPFSGPAVITPGAGHEVVLLHYDVPASPTTTGTAISFSDRFGASPVAIEVTIDTMPVTPRTIAGELSLGALFVRGQCNDDARLNIADAVSLLDSLFGVGNPLPAPTICGSDPAPGDLLGCGSSSCP